ncbi:uncharacterized protein LOC144113095 [Amblyomma americanum]|uniref:Uncharacterized protein n=1 Tax=Amblyomma americanum TaxID=6943 RepID=A0AAQ4EBN9_AMBAM
MSELLFRNLGLIAPAVVLVWPRELITWRSAQKDPVCGLTGKPCPSALGSACRGRRLSRTSVDRKVRTARAFCQQHRRTARSSSLPAPALTRMDSTEADSGEDVQLERPRNAVLLGCSAASIVATAVGVFAGIFLHPAIVLLLVLGNAASVALALRCGYRAVQPEPLGNAAKAPDGKPVLPVIQIYPPKMVTEL